jgi:ATP-dependent phosphofructokinase / diphosphate-dependent phosphofructokinase
MQRSLSGMTSPTDQAEAFWVGAMAVRYLMQDESDKMVTLVRRTGGGYHCETGLCDLTEVAQKTKLVPKSMINSRGNGMTEEFFEYVKPLAHILPVVRSLQGHRVGKKLGEFHRM